SDRVIYYRPYIMSRGQWATTHATTKSGTTSRGCNASGKRNAVRWRPCAGALLLTERRPRSSLRTDYPPGSAKTDTKFKDVRFWPIVDICFAPQNVRFWGKADMAIALRNVR